MNDISEAATQIVAAQASVREMTADEMAEALTAVAKALSQLADEYQPVNAKLETLRQNTASSIQKNGVICLECGTKLKLLGNMHLQKHGLTPTQYKEKWGIPKGSSLSSLELTQKRQRIAKQNNSGWALRKWRDSQGAK